MKKLARIPEKRAGLRLARRLQPDRPMETRENPTMPLVRDLWNSPISKLKRTAHTYGECNPVGDGDAKTASPSTYRPVGATCPETCAYLGNGCYAEGGNVNLHQTRSADDVGPSVRAAAIGIVWAARVGKLCRLHVSGDFMRQGRIDHRYIVQVGLLCDAVRQVAAENGDKVGHYLAWSYTHIDRDTFMSYKSYLDSKGVHVRWSDYAGPDGAIISDFDALPALKSETGLSYVKCPAQMPQGLTCDQCRICWELPSHTVVFEPHGATKRKARTAALNVLQ